MKERPILFSGPMVRAILEGRKTQTRRIMKPQPSPACEGLCTKMRHCFAVGDSHCHQAGSTPYGLPGDRLWVRETWMPFDSDHTYRGVRCAYKASTTPDGEEIRQEYIKCGRDYRWRPSIHMPRWASRITLEIVSVRVERLQDISEEDAIREGIPPLYHGEIDCGSIPRSHLFRDLWESINGPGSWNANPWVFVLEFKQVTP